MERFISSMIQVLSGDFNIFLLHGPRQHGYKQHSEHHLFGNIRGI